MKICVLTHTFPKNKKDFSAAFMKEFADGLVEVGNEVVVLAPYDQEFRRSGDKFKIELYKYVWPDSLHLMGYSRAMKADVSLKVVNFLLLPFMLFFGSIALIRIVKREKIDIINVHWILPNGVIALVASLVTGVPFVITLPGTDTYLATRNKIFGFVAKTIALGSSGIVSNSSWLLKKIVNLGVNEKPTAVVSYPTDVTDFRPQKKGLDSLRNRLNITNSTPVILAVGRMVYKKGFTYLLNAMPSIIKKFPAAKLVLGGDGDLRQKLEKEAAKLKVIDNVVFAGNINRDELSQFYNLADIFVAPSIVDKEGNVDGGPVVCYESMACGKPQVVTNVLGVADIIKQGINGFVVKEKSSKELSQSIIRLLSSKELRKKMGKVNRKLIFDTLNTKKIGVKYTKFFNAIINDAK